MKTSSTARVRQAGRCARSSLEQSKLARVDLRRNAVRCLASHCAGRYSCSIRARSSLGVETLFERSRRKRRSACGCGQLVIVAAVRAVRFDRASAESLLPEGTAQTWVAGHLLAGGRIPRHRCAARLGVGQAAGSRRESIGTSNRAGPEARRAGRFASDRLGP
jgi:hypothetical protein